MFPPIPTWDGLHPLVVHFPIALLTVAPVLIILGLFVYRGYFWFAVSALALMALGTIAAFVAVASGEAAAELAMRSPQINAVLGRHEELAETARTVFLGLTLLFAAITFVPLWVKRPMKRTATTVIVVVFLLIYGGGVVLLANAAHQGGRLVHEFGVHALIAESPADATPPSVNSSNELDDD